MNKKLTLFLALALATTTLAGCLGGGSDDDIALSQTGSSTVLPLASVWAEAYDGASIAVSGGGSSHGLNFLLKGQAHLGDASRKIGPGDYDKVGCSVSASEIDAAQTGDHPWTYPECNDVTPTEWVVAFDALTVVVHPTNDYATELNFTQLRSIFTTEDTARYWDQVPGLEDTAPHEEIQIYAPDAASGTYEFFFERVTGSTETSLLAAGNDRYTGSADDNVILNAIANNEPAIGFFGFAYYEENQQLVEAVSVAEDTDHVEPSFENVEEYPITRPLHVYTDDVPSDDGGEAEAIRGYLQYALGPDGQQVTNEVGYIPVADVNEDLSQAQLDALS